MPRKRKIVQKNVIEDSKSRADRDEVKKYLYKAQTDESYHKKYAKELRQLYEKMEHDDFTSIFIVCLKQLMQSDFNQFSNLGLKFMAEFVASFQAEDMHPLFDSLFLWIFKTVSPNPHIRLRLCEFVNVMLNSLPDDGDIEEFHCNEILSYMMDRLKDISVHVRVQAIKALCRLQNKDDPNDDVILIFLFHMECDPSPLVRQAVVSSIARSAHTIPFILERLRDVDERVRRTVLAQMSNYSLNRCTVDQRLTLIEQGLSDGSEAVRLIATKYMLPQWMTLCANNFITFLRSLKPYKNELEMCRYRTVARMALLTMFGSHDPVNLVKVLPLAEPNADLNASDQLHCIELNELTPELSVFWATLIEFFQSDVSYADHLDRILPDVPTICDKIARIQTDKTNDKLSSRCIFLSVIEMLQMNDLSDATGRETVKNTVVSLLAQETCDESLTKSLIALCEKLIPSLDSRLKFYVEIVNVILHPIDLNGTFSSYQMDANTNAEVSSLVAKLDELQHMPAISSEECAESSALKEEIDSVKKQLRFLITPFVTDATTARVNSAIERITSVNLLRGLKFIFHGVCSKSVTHLTPPMYQLYEDIISVRLESVNLEVKNWALKCTATFGLLCSKLAGYAYHAFCKQMSSLQVKSIWVTCIKAIFQLIDRYGFDFLDNNQMSETIPPPSPNNSLLNVTPMVDQSFDANLNALYENHEYENLISFSAGDILSLFKQYLTSSEDIDITCELVDGFCLLMVHGRFFDKEIMAKLIVMFFNADAEPIIVQILSVFFETMMHLNKKKYFQLSVRETLAAIVKDESFDESKLRSVLKFLFQAMMNDTASNTVQCSRLHYDLAATLLAWMDDQSTNSKSLNVVSKEILSLKPSFEDETSQWELIELVDNLLDQNLPKETEKNLKLFKNRAAQSTFTEESLNFSSTRPAGLGANDEISNPDENDFGSEVETDSNGNCDEAASVENDSQTNEIMEVPKEVPIPVSNKKRKRRKKVT